MARKHLIETALGDAMDFARDFTPSGKVATYIPELAKGNPHHLGACLITSDGEEYLAGDWDVPFTIQSISKTISLILALETAGYDRVFSRVGMEPTGDAFNSLAKLETRTTRPLNPMINAGAIAVASCCAAAGQTYDDFLALCQRLCGRKDISLNEEVYLSEQKAGMRNRSMAYLMEGDKILACDSETALALYFKMCSTNVTAKDLANYALVLAHNGKDPRTGEQLIPRRTARIVKTLMMTCGMYDASGEFALKVGVPCKSGVGGGIIGTVEGRMGMAFFGPALDQKGNSIGGCRAMEYLSRQLGLHYFSDTPCKV